MKSSIYIFAIFSFLFLLNISCSKDDEEEGTPAILTYEGFDFSEGIINPNPNLNDGVTISWQPNDGSIEEYTNGLYVWWRNSNIDTISYLNKTKDMGMVSLSSVNEIPDNWNVSPNIIPLLADHTYLAKCRDGYVKFKVNYYTIEEREWPVSVNYEFTNSTVFP